MDFISVVVLSLPIAWYFPGTWTVHQPNREIRNSLCIYLLAEVSGVAAILFSRHRIHFVFPKCKCCYRSRQKGFRRNQTPDCCLEQGINCHVGFVIFGKTFFSDQSLDWWRKPLMKCWMSASPPFASAHKATGNLSLILSALLLHRDPGKLSFDSGTHRGLFLLISRIHTFWCPVCGITPCVSNRGQTMLKLFHCRDFTQQWAIMLNAFEDWSRLEYTGSW